MCASEVSKLLGFFPVPWQSGERSRRQLPEALRPRASSRFHSFSFYLFSLSARRRKSSRWKKSAAFCIFRGRSSEELFARRPSRGSSSRAGKRRRTFASRFPSSRPGRCRSAKLGSATRTLHPRAWLPCEFGGGLGSPLLPCFGGNSSDLAFPFSSFSAFCAGLFWFLPFFSFPPNPLFVSI